MKVMSQMIHNINVSSQLAIADFKRSEKLNGHAVPCYVIINYYKASQQARIGVQVSSIVHSLCTSMRAAACLMNWSKNLTNTLSR